jgi:hypothetical protein
MFTRKILSNTSNSILVVITLFFMSSIKSENLQTVLYQQSIENNIRQIKAQLNQIQKLLKNTRNPFIVMSEQKLKKELNQLQKNQALVPYISEQLQNSGEDISVKSNTLVAMPFQLQCFQNISKNICTSSGQACLQDFLQHPTNDKDILKNRVSTIKCFKNCNTKDSEELLCRLNQWRDLEMIFFSTYAQQIQLKTHPRKELKSFLTEFGIHTFLFSLLTVSSIAYVKLHGWWNGTDMSSTTQYLPTPLEMLFATGTVITIDLINRFFNGNSGFTQQAAHMIMLPFLRGSLYLGKIITTPFKHLWYWGSSKFAKKALVQDIRKMATALRSCLEDMKNEALNHYIEKLRVLETLESITPELIPTIIENLRVIGEIDLFFAISKMMETSTQYHFVDEYKEVTKKVTVNLENTDKNAVQFSYEAKWNNNDTIVIEKEHGNLEYLIANLLLAQLGITFADKAVIPLLDLTNILVEKSILITELEKKQEQQVFNKIVLTKVTN